MVILYWPSPTVCVTKLMSSEYQILAFVFDMLLALAALSYRKNKKKLL